MRKRLSLIQPHIRAKILGGILVCIGIYFVFLSTDLFLKLGFSSILIGVFMIVMITEKTVPEDISNTQIQGQADAIKQLTTQLNLKGHAFVLPGSSYRSQERIFIPLKEGRIKLPHIDDDLVFSTGTDGASVGLVLPPSGLDLLHEVEKETVFSDNDIHAIEEKLQSFVGMDILKSVSWKKHENNWELTIEKPLYCINNDIICKQYPCPSCSAVLTAISKGIQKNLYINDVKQNGKKTTFYIDIPEGTET